MLRFVSTSRNLSAGEAQYELPRSAALGFGECCHRDQAEVEEVKVEVQLTSPAGMRVTEKFQGKGRPCPCPEEPQSTSSSEAESGQGDGKGSCGTTGRALGGKRAEGRGERQGSNSRDEVGAVMGPGGGIEASSAADGRDVEGSAGDRRSHETDGTGTRDLPQGISAEGRGVDVTDSVHCSGHSIDDSASTETPRMVRGPRHKQSRNDLGR